MRLIEFDKQSVPFADCEAILLMSRWRAIPSRKYVSIDASIISTYSLSVAPLVETRKKKGHSPVFLLKNVLYISLIFVLHTCCICAAYRLKSSTSDNVPQLL